MVWFFSFFLVRLVLFSSLSEFLCTNFFSFFLIHSFQWLSVILSLWFVWSLLSLFFIIITSSSYILDQNIFTLWILYSMLEIVCCICVFCNFFDGIQKHDFWHANTTMLCVSFHSGIDDVMCVRVFLIPIIIVNVNISKRHTILLTMITIWSKSKSMETNQPTTK